MERDEVIRIATDAGFSWYGKHMDSGGDHDVWEGDIERFASLVAAAQKERCAKVCEEQELVWGRHYAATIRALP